MILNIYVGDLPFTATKKNLRQTFETSARSTRQELKNLNGKVLLGKQMDIKEGFSPTLQGRHRTGYSHRSHHI